MSRPDRTARTARLLLATLVGVLVAGLAIPAQAVPGPAAVRPGRLAIGDSVMLGAAGALRADGFRVDAVVSRQFYLADDVLRAYGSAAPRNVVVHLGTNGTVTLRDCQRLVDAAGPNRRVFLVTNRVPRSWQHSNNATLRRCDASFPAARVYLVDWYAHSAGRSSWLYSDGYHLPPAGQRAYADLVDSTVDRYGR